MQSLVMSALAMAMLMKSSEIELGFEQPALVRMPVVLTVREAFTPGWSGN